MSGSNLIVRSGLNALLAGVIALGACIILFSLLTDMTMWESLSFGIPIALATLAAAWAGIFFILRARTPRERPRDTTTP